MGSLILGFFSLSMAITTIKHVSNTHYWVNHGQKIKGNSINGHLLNCVLSYYMAIIKTEYVQLMAIIY